MNFLWIFAALLWYVPGIGSTSITEKAQYQLKTIFNAKQINFMQWDNGYVSNGSYAESARKASFTLMSKIVTMSDDERNSLILIGHSHGATVLSSLFCLV